MKGKIISLFVCIILIGTIIVGSITIPASGKLTVSLPFNRERNVFFTDYCLSNDFDIPLNKGLDNFININMLLHHIPGLSATIVENGNVLWTESYGYSNISQSKYVEDSTLFMLASISKTFTATAIMQLYEDGHFDLDDPINDYLPFDVIHPTHPTTDITFHMLLTHSSSINDNYDNMPYYDGDSPIPLGVYLEDYLTPGGDLYDSDLNFNSWEPGVNYDYCNIAVALIGYLVEVISGTAFDEYCEVNIFEPLDMDETAWFLADLDVNNIAVPYHWNGAEYVPYGHFGYSDYPDGQLRTSITQLRNLYIMMLNNGEYNSEQILEEGTVELMLSSQLAFKPSQGLIWYRKQVGGRTLWGHNGGDNGVRTEMYLEPETNIVVGYLSNGEYLFRALISKLFNFAENRATDATVLEKHEFTQLGGKLLPNTFLLRLFERFPNMFPILRYLIGIY